MSGSDAACISTGWSVVASAPAVSQLVGVLAGFVFAGLILVLTRRVDSDAEGASLRLLMAAFIVLAMNSFLISLVTGDDEGAVCARVWTEFAVVSGLLAVGVVLVMSGLAWLLASHVDPDDPREHSTGTTAPQFALLQRFVNSSVYGVSAVSLLMLASAVNDYLEAVHKPGTRPSWAAFVFPLYLLTAAVAGSAAKAYAPRSGRRASDAVSIAVAASVAYTLVGAAAIGLATSTPVAFWNPTPRPVVWVTLVVVLIPPLPTILCVLYAVPLLPDGDAGARQAGPEPGRAVPGPASPMSGVAADRSLLSRMIGSVRRRATRSRD